MNDAALRSDKQTVKIGYRAHWGFVYRALNGTEVFVNGGRSPEPGVGRQTFAGGIG